MKGIIEDIAKKQKIFFDSAQGRSISYRKEKLKKLLLTLKEMEAEIFEALASDLGKPAFEAYTSETLMVEKEIKNMLKHLKYWSQPIKVSGSLLNFPSRDYLIPEPYGSVLIIAPWNYPFQLSLTPLVGAVAAGNCVVLKPSESAPATANILEKIIQKIFHPDHVCVVQGAAETGKALLEQQWNYIFFTGGTAIGKIVAKAAAEHLTPLTLELGGKSPCIVDGTSPLKKTARRIVWGKFLNCGQTCIAPDYLLVHEKFKDQLVEALIEEIENAFGKDAQQSEDYGRIIHDRHFSRMEEFVEGNKLLYGNQTDAKNRFFGPTLVEPKDENHIIQTEEIFGPILPILTYQDLSDITTIINRNPNPLAFYVFSKDKSFTDKLIRSFPFGGGVVNDVLIQFANANLPFGGIGNSGIGAYHGKKSFELFTHYKPVIKRRFILDFPQRYAPYKPQEFKLLKKITQWIN
ncbi:MAG: aldehyde dehydrogenase [Flavobacteriaceae bacterium]